MPFTVIYVEAAEGLEPWQFFECTAEDADHAEELCNEAHPLSHVLWINEGHGPASRTMI